MLGAIAAQLRRSDSSPWGRGDNAVPCLLLGKDLSGFWIVQALVTAPFLQQFADLRVVSASPKYFDLHDKCDFRCPFRAKMDDVSFELRTKV